MVRRILGNIDGKDFCNDKKGTLFEELKTKNNSNIFMDMSPQARKPKAKRKYWDKIKSFRTTKETINKTKRQPSEWEKIFANDMSY